MGFEVQGLLLKRLIFGFRVSGERMRGGFSQGFRTCLVFARAILAQEGHARESSLFRSNFIGFLFRARGFGVGLGLGLLRGSTPLVSKRFLTRGALILQKSHHQTGANQNARAPAG